MTQGEGEACAKGLSWERTSPFENHRGQGDWYRVRRKRHDAESELSWTSPWKASEMKQRSLGCILIAMRIPQKILSGSYKPVQ